MSKTSSRQNTQKYKGTTRKNGGFKVVGKIEYIKWSKYYFEGQGMEALPMPKESVEEFANKTIRYYLDEGKSLGDIKERFLTNLKRKKTQITIRRMMGLRSDSFSIPYKDFLTDWCISVAVCLKLKAIPNDANNGVLEYMDTLSGKLEQQNQRRLLACEKTRWATKANEF
jgi:hypothetical protein